MSVGITTSPDTIKENKDRALAQTTCGWVEKHCKAYVAEHFLQSQHPWPLWTAKHCGSISPFLILKVNISSYNLTIKSLIPMILSGAPLLRTSEKQINTKLCSKNLKWDTSTSIQPCRTIVLTFTSKFSTKQQRSTIRKDKHNCKKLN